MPKNILADYDSTTADNNTDIGGISIAEGMLPSAVNNSIRELTKQLGAMADGTDALTALSVDNLKLDGNTIVSTDTNGNITLDPNGTGEVSLGGDLSTNGNDVNFGDNDKAIFGAGSDFQIYHDGSNSYVWDSGTGNLILVSDGTGVEIKKNNGEYLASFSNDGAVALYYDNSPKLATTATGINVTGTVAATAFSGDGSALTGIGGGKVLQVVSYRYPTAQTFSNVTVNSWQDTGVALAITPSSSSSRILVIVNVTGAPHYTGSNAGMKFRITRNGSNIVNAFGNHVSSASNGERLTPVASFTDYDNPSTTSSRTYRVQVTSTTTTSTLYVNRNYNHTGYDSSITLIEIGA